jgi:hypothetical protein
MADTDTSRSTYVPTNDAYTGMLAISLVALIAGSVLLYLDYSQYPDRGPKAVEKAAPPQEKPVAPPPKVDAPPPAAPMPDEKKDEDKKDENKGA